MAEEVIIPIKFDFEGSGLTDLIKSINDIKGAGAGVASDLAKAFGDSLDKVDKDLESTKKKLQGLSDADGLSGLTDDVERLTKEQAKNVAQSVKFVDSFKDQQEALGFLTAEIKDLRDKEKELLKQQEILISFNQKGTQAYKDVNVAIGKNAVELKALTLQKQKVTQAMDRELKSALATKGSYNALVAETNVLRQRLKDLPDAFGKNAKAAAGMAAQIDKNNDQLKKFDKSIGDNFRNVGNYKDGITSATGLTSQFGGSVGMAGNAFGQLQQGLNVAKAGFGSLKAAIASTGIGLLVIALGLVISYLSKFDPLVDAIEQGMAALKAIFREVAKTVVSFGESIFNALKNPKQALIDLGNFIKNNIINRFKAFGVILSAIANGDLKGMANGVLQLGTGVENLTGKLQNAGAAMDKYAEKIAKAAREAANLKASQQDLEDQMQIQEVRNAEALQKIQELTVQSKNRTKSEGERLALLKKAEALDKQNFNERDFLAKREIRNAVENARIKGSLSQKELDDLQARGVAAAIDLQNKGKLEDEDVESFKTAQLNKIAILDEFTKREEKRLNKEDELLQKQQEAAEKAKEASEKRQQELNESFKKSLETRISILDASTTKEQNALKSKLAAGTISQETFEADGTRLSEDSAAKRLLIFQNFKTETEKVEGISAEVRKEILADLEKKIQESESNMLDFQINTNKKKVEDFQKSSDEKIKIINDEGARQELEIKRNLEVGLITQAQSDVDMQELKTANAQKEFDAVQAAGSKALLDLKLNAETRRLLELEFAVKSIEAEAKLVNEKIALAEKLKASRKAEVDELIKDYQKGNELAFAQAETEILNSRASEAKKKDQLEALKREQLDMSIGIKEEEIAKLKALGEDTIQQEIDLEKLKQQQILEAQKTGSAARLKEAKVFAQQILSNAITKAKEQSVEREKNIDADIAAQQENIKVQQQLAADGKKSSLDFERQKAADLAQAKLEEQRKREKLQKFEAFYEMFKSFVSGGNSAPVAAGKAAAGIAIADVIAAKLEEGTTGTLRDTIARQGKGGRVDANGISHGRKHSRGGIIVEMEAGEGMFSSNEMGNLGTTNFMNIKRLARRGRVDRDIINQGESITVMRQSNDTPKILAKLDEVRDAALSKPPLIYNSYTSLGDFVQKEIHDGITNHITHKRRRIG